MDILWSVLLMILLYALPELFKRRNKKEYKYPEIPDNTPQPTETKPLPPADKKPAPARPPRPVQPSQTSVITVATPAPVVTTPRPPVVMPQEVQVPVTVAAETPAWEGQLSHAAVLNGIIYAEILQPPRSQRPMHQRFVPRR